MTVMKGILERAYLPYEELKHTKNAYLNQIQIFQKLTEQKLALEKFGLQKFNHQKKIRTFEKETKLPPKVSCCAL